jgi:Fe2+ or Zn2+ uptake regulation protein
MKRHFKCLQCGATNEFDTDSESFHATLRECDNPPEDDIKDVYVLYCKNCGAENRVEA